ncbi:MAG: DUF6279 family lipoprotein [Gammaproteobacteria bacterium]|nr:DUF6279 family lipoprotein [Gammaproteobacteria bacterium]
MWLRGLLLLVCCGALGACSNTFLYNQLDWLIPWYVDDSVDFTRDQKKSFKQQLLPLLEWHRGEELDNYLLMLALIEADLQQPLTVATVSGWSEEFVAGYQRLEDRSMPLAFELGEQLSAAQLAEFMAGLYEEQEEFEEEYLSRTGEEVHQSSYESFADNVADVLGRLQPSQKERLREAAAELQRFDHLWLEQRRWWLEQTEELLQREPGWQQRARDLMARRDEVESPEYRKVSAHNQQIIYAALADVINARTEKQDARLRREIDGIRQDLLALISQGE